VSEGSDSWRPIADHKTWSSIDAEVVTIGDARYPAVARVDALEVVAVDDDFTTRPDGAYALTAAGRPTWVGVLDSPGSMANAVVETRSGKRALWDSTNSTFRQYTVAPFDVSEFTTTFLFAPGSNGVASGIVGISNTAATIPYDFYIDAIHIVVAPGGWGLSFYSGLSAAGNAGYNIANLATVNGSAIVTAPAGTFDATRDVGRVIRGPGIAAADASASGVLGSKIISVQSSMQVTLSTPATATATVAAAFDVDFAGKQTCPSDGQTPCKFTVKRIDTDKIAVTYNGSQQICQDARIATKWGRKVGCEHYQPASAAGYLIGIQRFTALRVSYPTDQITAAAADVRSKAVRYAPSPAANQVVASDNVMVSLAAGQMAIDVTFPASGMVAVRMNVFVNWAGGGTLYWALNPGRTIASVVTNITAGTEKVITAPAGSFFTGPDEGKTISGTGIPAGTIIATVDSPTQATMSANATAAGTITATVGLLTDYITQAVAVGAINSRLSADFLMFESSSGVPFKPGDRYRFQARARVSVAGATHYFDGPAARPGLLVATPV
jgi:hypothetical protein